MSDWPGPKDPPEHYLLGLIDFLLAQPKGIMVTRDDLEVLMNAHGRILDLKKEIEDMHAAKLAKARAEAEATNNRPGFRAWPYQLGQIP